MLDTYGWSRGKIIFFLDFAKFLVCQQTAKIFNSITKKLKLKGKTSNQIIHGMY